MILFKMCIIEINYTLVCYFLLPYLYEYVIFEYDLEHNTFLALVGMCSLLLHSFIKEIYATLEKYDFNYQPNC